MAYGDATRHSPPVRWEELEYVEYLYRLEDLLKERHRAFSIAHGNPDDPRAEEAAAQLRRRDKKLVGTALEFVAYAARQGLEGET